MPEDETRLWDRIREDVTMLSNAHDIEIPEKLMVNEGSYWERDMQRRQALNQFMAEIPGAPIFEDAQPLHEIADALDEFVILDDERADEPEI